MSSSSDEETEGLVFYTPSSERKHASSTSKKAATQLRAGSISENSSIPSSEFIKAHLNGTPRRKKKKSRARAKEDDEEGDEEDNLTVEDIKILYRKELENKDGFVVDSEEEEGVTVDDESENASDEDEAVECSDDEECSWKSSSSGEEDDSDSSGAEGADDPLYPWTILNFSDKNVKKTFLTVTTKQMFSLTKREKLFQYGLMRRCLVYPCEKGVGVYKNLRKSKETVGKDRVLSEFEELKVLCRSLERDVAATITNNQRAKRAERNAKGVRRAPQKKGPSKAKDICMSLENAIKEVVKLQLKDFKAEKETNIATEERPYRKGIYASAAHDEAIFIRENDTNIKNEVIAYNIYMYWSVAIAEALFNDKFDARRFTGGSYHVIHESERSCKIVIYDGEKVPIRTSTVDSSDLLFYRALLNLIYLPVTTKMLIVATMSSKRTRICKTASRSSSISLDVINPSNFADLITRIIAQSQELYALAFPDNPQGHQSLAVTTS